MAVQTETRKVNLVINGSHQGATPNDMKRNITALNREIRKMNKQDNPALRNKKILQLQKMKQTYKEMMREINGVTKANSKFLGGFKTLVGGFLGASAIFTVFNKIKEGLNVFKDFEAAISSLGAISGATAKQLAVLREEAKKLGETTIFTATEVANMQTELAKKGFDSDQILAATAATLDLAAATGEDLVNSVEVATSTLNAFGLPAEETPRIVDVMAKSFSSSALDLEKFKESMKFVGPVAKAANIDIETTTALLAKLADKGLSGSIAGNALKKLLSELATPTSDLSKELGIVVKNSDDLIRAFEIASEKGIDLATASEITGERSKVALLALADGSGLREFKEDLEEATGAAKEMAAIRLDNLAGDMLLAKSASEGLAIAFGEKLGDSSRGLVKVWTSFLGILTRNISGILQFTKVLILGATAWGVYRTAVLLSTRANMAYIRSLAISQNLMKLQRLATLAAAAAQALFTGNIKKARIAMRAFNIVSRLNPIGLIVTALVAATAAFALFNKELSRAEKIQESLNDLNVEAEINIVKERIALEQLVSTAKDSNRSLEDREAAILEINKISPEYLGNITLETINTKESTTAINQHIASLKKQALAKALQIKLEEAAVKIIELEGTTARDLDKWYDSVLTRGRGRGGSRLSEQRAEAQADFDALSALAADIAAEASKANAAADDAPGGGTGGLTFKEKEDAKKKAEDEEKAREKELENIRKGFEKIQGEVDKHNDKLDVDRVDKDQQELEKINQKYEAQFNKLKEHLDNLTALEGLSDEERAQIALTGEVLKEELLDSHRAVIAQKITDQDAQEAIKTAADKETLRVALLTEREKEIDDINLHYDALEVLAEGDAEAIAKINEKRNKAIADSNKAANAKDLAEDRKTRNAKIALARGLSGAFTELANLTAKQGAEMNAFQRASAVAGIAVNTGISISEAMKDSQVAGVTPIDKAIIFAATLAQIFAGVGQAKKILKSSNSPSAPQFYGGGLTDVTGAQDGRQYRAQDVGSFQHGGAYKSPSYGLIAEKGPELVVPNGIYTNPANANIMEALEQTISRQFAHGGSTVGGTSEGPATQETEQLTRAVNMLVATLNNGIEARTYFNQQTYEEEQDLRDRSRDLSILN